MSFLEKIGLKSKSAQGWMAWHSGLHRGMGKAKHTGSVSVCHGVELGGLIMLST
jgi:urocanate hydratase